MTSPKLVWSGGGLGGGGSGGLSGLAGVVKAGGLSVGRSSGMGPGMKG